MKIKHSVGTDSLECDLIETENPPKLVYDDREHVFCDLTRCEYFILRETVYDMLCRAATNLPASLRFKAFELYRPMKRQISFWNELKSEYQKKYPFLTCDELDEKVNVFVANPYKQGSGHQTGAAIDLTLCDSDGAELDMGTRYREFNERTATFPADGLLTEQQMQNRQILCQAMEKAGFVNYFEEWWHYSYGEIEWAVIARTGKTLYLPLKQ